MTTLLNVDSALAQILADMSRLDAETIALSQSLNRIIATDIASPIDLPPFDNSAMDGYAIHFEDSADANRDHPAKLSVTMDIMAGKVSTGYLERGQAARIMTGAAMPAGATAVIPVEETDDDWQKAQNNPLPKQVKLYASVKQKQNIRQAGENIAAGALIMSAGTRIRPAEIGMLAAIGCASVEVVRQPKVVILSSGDELVDVDEPLKPGKIRNTNSYTLAGLIQGAGAIPICLPTARDSLAAIRALYQQALAEKPDLILSTAGVSVGAADLVRQVMEELGDIDFWRINMRPGKPLAYGTIQGIPFFGLPGNPVSAMVTYEVLVRPALAKIGGRDWQRSVVKATIADDLKSDGRRSYHRVTLTREGNRLIARSTGIQSSGALMSMVLADGLAIIPEGKTFVTAGSELPILPLREGY